MGTRENLQRGQAAKQMFENAEQIHKEIISISPDLEIAKKL